MSRPNFKIIEVKDNFPQDSFNKDYMNTRLSKKALMDKYSMNESQWASKSRHARKETGYCRQKGYSNGDDTKNITKLATGYRIQKTIRGFYNNFGTYPDFKTARMVRDLLIDKNWDKNYAQHLIKKYAKRRSRIIVGNQYVGSPMREMALDKYDEFEELYLSGEYSCASMLEKLEFSRYQYSVCLDKLREEYPDIRKKLVRA